jgi:hypothetical protein
MATEESIAKALEDLAYREAMLRSAAKRLLDEAEKLKERRKRIQTQFQRMKTKGEPPPDLGPDAPSVN